MLCDVVGVDAITDCEFTCDFCLREDFIPLIRKLEAIAYSMILVEIVATFWSSEMQRIHE